MFAIVNGLRVLAFSTSVDIEFFFRSPRQQTGAREYTSIATLLVYPLVRRISRFNFPRHTECSP